MLEAPSCPWPTQFRTSRFNSANLARMCEATDLADKSFIPTNPINSSFSVMSSPSFTYRMQIHSCSVCELSDVSSAIIEKYLAAFTSFTISFDISTRVNNSIVSVATQCNAKAPAKDDCFQNRNKSFSVFNHLLSMSIIQLIHNIYAWRLTKL